MPNWVLVFTISILYLVISLVLGILSGRHTKMGVEGFIVGNRAVGVVLTYFILGATVVSAYAFLGGPGWAYSKGAPAYYILATGILSFVPLYLFGPKMSRLGRKYGYVTQADLLSDRFESPALSGLIAWVSLLAFIPYLTLQMQAANYIFYIMTDGHIPLWLGGLLAYGTVIIYVMASGLMGLGWVNVFQGIIMIVLAWSLGLYLPFKIYGGLTPMFQQIMQAKPEFLTLPGPNNAMPWSFYTSSVIVVILGWAMWPHLFMKAYISKDEQTFKRSLILYPTFQIVLLPPLLVGLAGILYTKVPLENPDMILPYLVMNLGFSPIWAGIFCSGVLAASMSTGDAVVHAAGSIMLRDFYLKVFNKEMSEKRQTFYMRLLVLIFGAIAYLFTLTSKVDLVLLLLYAYGAVVQFFPLVIATFFWPRATKAGALAGLTTGTLVTILFAIFPQPFGIPHIHHGLWGLAFNTLVLIIVSLKTKPHKPEHVYRFINV